MQTTPTDRVSACAAPNSSGPNSGGNDNCRWTVTPGFNFNTVVLTTEIGTVALEGSGDFANDPNFDSLFYLSNSVPVATADTVTTPEDTAVTFNVLANDTDGDGDPLSATILMVPAHGTVVPAASAPGFTYTPTANYFGPDSFTYTVTDGTDSSIGTVTINVSPVNDAPVAVSGTSATPEETTVTLTVATDIDSTILTSACTSNAGGSIVDNTNGSVNFTPPLNFTGSATIVCSTTDSSGATTATSATVTVGVSPVNDAPVAVADLAEVNKNGTVAINVVANDTDVDGDTLVVGGVTTAPANGIAVVTGGSIQYTPSTGFTGTDSFAYTVTDGTATSGPATVTITVHPVICSAETVSDSDGNVSGSFTRLDNVPECKRYVLDANAAAGTVLFVPNGTAQVDYRGYLTFAPALAPGGVLTLSLEYDPTGGTTFKAVQLCINPQFDGTGAVTAATLPVAETWCIASETTRGDVNGNPITTWQVFGRDDPRFQ